jgi:hypothetical protein
MRLDRQKADRSWRSCVSVEVTDGSVALLIA